MPRQRSHIEVAPKIQKKPPKKTEKQKNKTKQKKKKKKKKNKKKQKKTQQQLLVKRVVKYIPSNSKDKLTRKISRELNESVFNDVDAIFFSDFMKAYVVGTHLNCLLVEAIQMSTNNICSYKAIKKNTRYGYVI